MSAAEQQKPARKRAPRKTPDAPAPTPSFEGYLAGATLWRVVLPERIVNGRAYSAACVGVYVRDGFAIQAAPLVRWMIGQSWDEKIVPWLSKNGASGRPLATGERLEM